MTTEHEPNDNADLRSEVELADNAARGAVGEDRNADMIARLEALTASNQEQAAASRELAEAAREQTKMMHPPWWRKWLAIGACVVAVAALTVVSYDLQAIRSTQAGRGLRTAATEAAATEGAKAAAQAEAAANQAQQTAKAAQVAAEAAQAAAETENAQAGPAAQAAAQVELTGLLNCLKDVLAVDATADGHPRAQPTPGACDPFHTAP